MGSVLADIGTFVKIALGAFVATGVATGLMGRLASPAAGLTSAPDLVSVGSFRSGPDTDDGRPQTIVDFAFDQEAALTGGDRSNFHLVDIQRGRVLDGRAAAVEGDQPGDTVVAVAFLDRLEAGDMARGYVDAETVSDPEQPTATNTMQSTDVSGGGATAGPDLVSVTPDQGRLLYRFDQDLALGGGGDVQDTQGFTTFDAAADSAQANTARPTDDDCRCEIAATFDAFDVTAAVGASVSNGAVADRDVDDLVNQPDEVVVTNPGTGAAACDVGAPDEVGEGWTEAPDLVSIGNFREGPPNDEGRPMTCVDFTFDQPVYLGGGNRTSFHLVPADGGQVIDATAQPAAEEIEGDERVTVIFSGQVSAQDVARGYVDSEVLTSKADGDGPYNIVQSAPVSAQGTTPDPDLVSVRQDRNTLLYTFDQSIAEDDDVIQSTSGLRFYTAQAPVGHDIGAVSVAMVDDRTLRAVFDTPADITVADAVGGYVQQGTVVGADRDDDGTFEPNALHEARLGKPINADVACSPGTAEDRPDGWTAAPDLVFVGNFRPGPYTPELEATTCVDYVFDVAAHLGGGNRTSFHLVPAAGGDALDASDLTPQRDREGDSVITVKYLGKHDPEAYARGFVDGEVVTAAADGDGPYNVVQSAAVAGDGISSSPDLVSIRQDRNTLLYAFDQSIAEDDDVIQSTSGLRFYIENDPAINDFGAVSVAMVDDRTLRAVFDTPADITVADAVGGYVQQGTVVGADRDDDGTFPPNALDERRIGDPVVAAVTCAPATGADDARPGWTDAPDLVAVGNFRPGPYTPELEATTCVDYHFDTAVYLGGGNRTSFHVVPAGGDDVVDATGLVPATDRNGDRVVTAQYLGDLDAADIARGYVDGEVVTGKANGDGPYNVLQAEPVTDNGRTDDPDLDAAVIVSDTELRFTFDEPLDTEDVVQDTAGLRLYTKESKTYTASRVSATDDPAALIARFDLPEGVGARDAVGAIVIQGTVVAPDDDGPEGDGTKEAVSPDEVRISASTGGTAPP